MHDSRNFSRNFIVATLQSQLQLQLYSRNFIVATIVINGFGLDSPLCFFVTFKQISRIRTKSYNKKRLNDFHLFREVFLIGFHYVQLFFDQRLVVVQINVKSLVSSFWIISHVSDIWVKTTSPDYTHWLKYKVISCIKD